MNHIKLFLLLFLIINISQINSFAIGIDFGTEFIKIVLVRPGKPFSIVENIQSKRKTPSAVCLKDEERVFGSDALNKKFRTPQQVFVYSLDYLTKSVNDPSFKEFLSTYFVSNEIEEDKERATIQFKLKYLNKEFRFFPEEVVGMILRYAKYLSDKFSQADIKDCVITVPNFFSYKERQAIHQSAQIAGLSVLALVNENVGAAVQYALERRFNKTENIIFYNMGSSYTQVTLVNFATLKQNQTNNKTIDYNSINVLNEAWDKNLGGRNFDYNIIRHMMEIFDNLPQRKGKPSVSKNPKIAEKMLQTAIQAKEVLSANKEAVIQVLTVEDNLNLMTKISKETFEKFSHNEFNRVFEPLSKLLKNSNMTINDIDQVELIGGSIRIPKVQDILKENVGANKIGVHMNGDESVAFGVAFIAANFSSNFRARKLDLYHGTNYELKIKLTAPANSSNFCQENLEEYAVDCIRRLNKETTIFALRRGLDVTRIVSFKHDSDFDVAVFERLDGSDEEILVVKYRVTNVNSAIKQALEKENITPGSSSINLRFKMDRKGLLDFKADLAYNVTSYFAMLTNNDGTVKFMYTSNKTEPLTESQLSQDVKPASKMNETKLAENKKKVGQTRQKQKKTDLTIHKDNVNPLPLTDAQIKDGKSKLDSLDKHDEIRLKTMERRNYLETFLIDKSEWIEGKEALTHSKKEERDSCSSILKEMKDWFEEDGFIADLALLEKKIKELTSPFDKIFNRIDNLKKLVKAQEKYSKEMEITHKNAKNLIGTKPWTKEHYKNTFQPLYDSTRKWYSELKKKQDLLLPNEDPVLRAELIEKKILAVMEEYKKMSKIPKPKVETSKNKTSSNNAKETTNTETKNNTDFSKEEIEKMINNANNIEELKELLVYYNLMKKKFNLEQKEEGKSSEEKNDTYSEQTTTNSTQSEENDLNNENKDEM